MTTRTLFAALAISSLTLAADVASGSTRSNTCEPDRCSNQSGNAGYRFLEAGGSGHVVCQGRGF